MRKLWAALVEIEFGLECWRSERGEPNFEIDFVVEPEWTI